jgi:hypothetical protein
MKYLLLIYWQPAVDALEAGDEAAWERFNRLLDSRDAWLGSEALTRASSARTKEQLAGYYLVDCGGWDEALEFAALIPSAADGSASIEVRAVLDWEEPS